MERKGCMSGQQGCGCSIIIIGLLNLVVAFLVVASAVVNGLSLIGGIVLVTVLGNAAVFILLGLRLRKNPSLVTSVVEEAEEGEEDNEDEESEESEEDVVVDEADESNGEEVEEAEEAEDVKVVDEAEESKEG